MQCRFYVGQRVVCVDANPRQNLADNRFNDRMNGLTEGELYTVRAVMMTPELWGQIYPDLANQVWVYLKEIHRDEPFSEYNGFPFEVGFRHTRFRPATDISILEALLTMTRTPEHAA